MTKRAQYCFKLKSYPHNGLWIYAEPYYDNCIFEDGFIGFDLKENISVEEAEKVINLLNDKITNITFTKITT